jgi:hypothetical protein
MDDRLITATAAIIRERRISETLPLRRAGADGAA